ncbi:2922_t:CDS:2, partial [Acaulospora colombiana]
SSSTLGTGRPYTAEERSDFEGKRGFIYVLDQLSGIIFMTDLVRSDEERNKEEGQTRDQWNNREINRSNVSIMHQWGEQTSSSRHQT